MSKIKIAIASGKGGTGKTLVAVNLCRIASESHSVAYVDCDVEAPNGHIFLKPEFTETLSVKQQIPLVDLNRCTGCGRCAAICQFHAILCLHKEVMVFPELCHACGGCMRVCPENAITETGRVIGHIDIGKADSIHFIQGVLNVGEPMAPPLIKAVKNVPIEADLVILDSSPGTSCPVVETVRGSALAVLVTDATPFGLHDLKLAVETLRILKLPFVVVVNRADAGDREVFFYCSQEGIKVLAEIPDDRRIAEAYSGGELIVESIPSYRPLFASLQDAILREADLNSGRSR